MGKLTFMYFLEGYLLYIKIFRTPKSQTGEELWVFEKDFWFLRSYPRCPILPRFTVHTWITGRAFWIDWLSIFPSVYTLHRKTWYGLITNKTPSVTVYKCKWANTDLEYKTSKYWNMWKLMETNGSGFTEPGSRYGSGFSFSSETRYGSWSRVLMTKNRKKYSWNFFLISCNLFIPRPP